MSQFSNRKLRLLNGQRERLGKASCRAMAIGFYTVWALFLLKTCFMTILSKRSLLKVLLQKRVGLRFHLSLLSIETFSMSNLSLCEFKEATRVLEKSRLPRK